MILGALIPSHVAGETVDGETIVLNLLTGAYHSLQGEAAQVWGTITSSETHEVDPRIDQILADFLAAEIIEWSGARNLPTPSVDARVVGLTSYTDMTELLAADPIHEVDERGWPKLREERP